jgi:hypothetical protein
VVQSVLVQSATSMRVYFDRNIFDALRKLTDSSKSPTALAKLREATSDGRLTILFSHVVLEETFPLLKRSAGTFEQEIKALLSLVDARRMIKLSDSLLREAVQSYAFRRRLPEMLTRTPRTIRDFLTNGRVTKELEQFIEAIQSNKQQFVQRLSKSFTEAQRLAVERNIGSPKDFQEFWIGMAPVIVTLLAERYGVDKRCLARGIEGLLENRTVKLYAAYYASFTHSKWFGEQGKPGKVIGSERGDFFHAVQASAADLLVTN